MVGLVGLALPTGALAVDLARPATATQVPQRFEASNSPSTVRLKLVTVLGKRGKAADVPGSAHTVRKEELQVHEDDDIHRVLKQVPGVYVREEDGYGLRPNIGMRGVSAERSKKVTLMEDGVLFAPAPYAAPAAYYFPMMTRIERVEVLKGPTTVRFGPSTVAGAVNLVTRAIPYKRRIRFDTAGGNTAYGKLHLDYGESTEHFGWLVEAVKLRSGGYKELDGGGDTGFDKHDVSLKLRVNNDPEAERYQQLVVQLGYADEVSNETYLGLSEADVRATPYRRYAATALDRMQWRRYQLRASHRIEWSEAVKVTTTAYMHHFWRDWRKLAGLKLAKKDLSLDEVLANPVGNNETYYRILTGAGESAEEGVDLSIGSNDRTYLARGVQSRLRAKFEGFGLGHDLEVGLRLHHDTVDRLHTTERHVMAAGRPRPGGEAVKTVLDAKATALAWSGHVQDRLRWGDLAITAGLRGEWIDNSWVDRGTASNDKEASYTALIPGVALLYKLPAGLRLLAGVHKGFVPVGPGQAAEILPEESTNYEAGLRYAARLVEAEVIGFFSDYRNLKGTCSFSGGCLVADIGKEFNGGEVRTYGVEAQVGAAVPLRGGYQLPLRLGYTYTDSTFATAFDSSNPQWGEVAVGDEMPYLPTHQLGASVGVQGHHIQVALSGRYASAMRNTAGQGESQPEDRTDETLIFDVVAHYDLGHWGRPYLSVRNLLDSAQVVSRRPFGARPGMRRLVVVGYKHGF